MTPIELRDAGVQLYGGRGWQTRLAEELGVAGSTVRRWAAGTMPIPRVAQVAIGLLLRVQELEAA